MTFNDALSVFDHLLDNYSQNLTAGLNSIPELSPQLRDEVTALISAHEQNVQQTLFSNIIAAQVDTLDADKDLLSLTGEQIQHFKLKTLLGSGGMGVVYLAERCDGQLEQQVAIKIIAPSITLLTSKELAFKEAQYLARLNHPNIAKVYDVGTTESGLIYLIMEYIEGDPLQQFCATATNDEMLRLLIKVCDAVSYSHQNRIIHGDLKPDNILVDKLGEPKLVDFGVAHTLSEQSNATYSAYINGLSRDYASPEQLAGEPLTTQSDVYSLGKILKKRLNSETNRAKVNADLLAVLDRATSAALSVRYSSIALLQADLHAVYEKKPLSATTKKNTILYRLQKRFYRQPFLTSLLSVAVLAIITMTAALIVKNQHLNEQYQQKSAIVNYLKDVFYAADPRYYNGEKPDYAQLLYSGSANLDTQLPKQNDARIEIKEIIARALLSLGDYERARMLLESDIDSNKLNIPLAETMFYQGAYDQADELLSKLTLRHGSEEWIEKIIIRSAIQLKRGNNKEAVETLDKLVNLVPSTANQQRQLIQASVKKAIAYDEQSMFQKALQEIQKASKLAEATYPADHIGLLDVYNTHGNILSSLGELEKASKIYKKHLNITKKVLGEQHPSIGNAYRNIGFIEEMQDHFELAIEYYKSSESIFLESYGEDHEQLAFLWNDIGIASRLRGDFEQSEHYLLKAATTAKKVLGKNNPNVASILGNLAIAQFYLKRHEQAIDTLNSALKIDLLSSGELHSRTGHRYFWLGFVHANIGNYDKALKFNSKSVAIFSQIYPNGNTSTWDAIMHKMVILLAKKDYAGLEDSFAIAEEFISNSEDPSHFLNDMNIVKVFDALLRGDIEKAKLASSKLDLNAKHNSGTTVLKYWKSLPYKKTTDLTEVKQQAYNPRGVKRAEGLDTLQNCFINKSISECTIASPVLLLL
ncbi:serine/threonine-protein kinase [Pseudoalteromonas sp. Of11M-6]|uniref:serine/threonine-protein kinase n=1 Tax=Pseudoalteromonas sp. Of11M-6 TaxID=2917754 RepID=UPI001EF6EC59|nr:serine/threonine-protein kinase [Pseudoalteromonas sp. Of11M-6]MCG7554706.1 serine/threonine-protein kinase [Pseudoalteromonas sp. Of11M-6]